MKEFLMELFGRQRQSKQVQESRERLANTASDRLSAAVEENTRVAYILDQLVREMQGRAKQDRNNGN